MSKPNLKHKPLDSRVDIVQTIKNSLEGAAERNLAQARKRKAELLATLKDNLKSGQTKEMNQWLIDKYVKVRPNGLNQMQQAFAEAV